MAKSNLAEDLASGDRDNLAPSRAAASTPNGDFLREMLVSDLNWTALQIGVTCLVVTACAAPGCRFGLRSLRHVAHDDTRAVRLALRYGETFQLSTPLQLKLDAFYAGVSAMRSQLQPFIGAASLSPQQVDQMARLLPALRKTALSAIEALKSVDPLVRAHLHSNYAYDGETIQKFLARAVRGDLTDIDRFGVVTPPAMKQRRQSPRVGVERKCRIAFAGREVDATLVDVSRAGAGVLCREAIAEGEAVELLVNGRRLAAVVARRVGEHCGLSLKLPLSLSDPLFQAA